MFDILNEYIIHNIIAFLPGPMSAPLRETCTYMRDIIPPPEHMLVRKLLQYAIVQKSFDLCLYAFHKSQSTDNPIKSIEIMSFAIDEFKDDAYDMCIKAYEICPLTIQQCNYLMHIATVDNCKKICIQAYEWGATNIDHMLRVATSNNNRELCILAHSLGASDFNCMLDAASSNNNRELCILARFWGATHVNRMLTNGAYYGHIDICILAHEWGATSFSRMLENAHANGHEHICALAFEWINNET